MKVRTTKDILKDLAGLDISKATYVVCEEWEYIKSDEDCPYCNGEGRFKNGTQIYNCNDCNQTGKVGVKKKLYVVKLCTHEGYPDVSIEYNTVQMPFYYDIQGFFNKESDACKLANALNKGR